MKRFNNIVYILNNETSTLTPSFTQAINLAKTNQAKLTLLQIHSSVKSANLTNLTGLSESLIKEKVQTKELDRLNALIQPLKQELEIAIDIRFGKKYIEAIQAVHDKQFDLVIKEATKVDWLDRFLGSDDMHLLRKYPCPVWMMPPVSG